MQIPGLLKVFRPAQAIQASESFATRSLVNQVFEATGATVKAGSVHLPTLPVYTNENVPMTQPVMGWSDALEDRAIRSDPRENWYLTLPEKLTPQQAVNIIRAALGGDIWQLHMLDQLMESRWPTYRMAKHQLREAAAFTKYTTHPHCEEGEEPTPEATEKAALVARAMRSFSPNQFTDEKGFSGFVYDCANIGIGMSVEEIIWQRKRTKKYGEEMLPRAACFVHPRHFTFNNLGVLCVYDNDYAREYDDPNTQRRNPILWGTEPDPDKFICAQVQTKSGSALGAGYMLPIIWLFVARQWCNEWALNTAKQFGSAFIDITYKPGSSDVDERAKLAAFLKNAGAERRLIHPEGTVATIHPAQSLGSDNPQRYILEESDKQCLFLLLGQTGTTQATPGKLGDSSTHQDVKEERVLGLTQWLAHNPIKQFARAVLRQNYGNDDDCPEIVPDRTRPLSSGEVGALVTQINGSGIPVRADEFYKKIGFSQPEPGDVIIQRGEVSEMLTEEEKYEQHMEQAQDQMEMQAQAQGQPQEQVEASDKAIVRFDTATVLHRCTPEQLREVESLVTAAERATHLNGEHDALQRHLKKLFLGQSQVIKAKTRV